MRRTVSQEQSTDRAEKVLHLLVRILARSAARKALLSTTQCDGEQDRSSLPSAGGDHAK